MFAYCQQPGWWFDENGEPTTNAPTALPPTEGDAPFHPDEYAALAASGRDADAASAFLSWLVSERSVPGECVLVAGTDSTGVFVLSEHGADSRCLKRYDMASGCVECLTPTNTTRELIGPIFLPDTNDSSRLAGLVWRSPDGNETEWLDPIMQTIEKRLRKDDDVAEIDYTCHSPKDIYRWLAFRRFRSKPPEWLLVDAAAKEWKVLSEYPVEVSPTMRCVVRYTASDGAGLCGVFTRPDASGPFPLVVFPHGGPGAMSDTAFDERVWALCDAGFAVFQPNYRGSAGFGKRFRLNGWGAEGIKRAMLDIREGVEFVMGNSEYRIAPDRPALLGGSWGGYCAVEQLAMFPDAYSGAVSFFGAFDLPMLVEGELRRVAGLDPGEADAARRELIRQFGNPSNPDDMAKLLDISPIHQLDAIKAPVILFHNGGDTVIPFQQSAQLYQTMTNNAMQVEFHVGDGDHGFSPEYEAGVYVDVVQQFIMW